MIIAIIPAKLHSNRLKNKNLIKIKGKTLIERAIDYISKSKKVNDFYVSTESKKIQNFLKKKKIKFIIRPKHLCGEAPLLDVYKHAFFKIRKKHKIKTIVGIQCDHPDRKVKLDKAIQLFKKKKTDRLFSKDNKGNKNGAHTILSLKGLLKSKNLRINYIIDNCTNIHLKSDLKKASKNIKR